MRKTSKLVSCVGLAGGLFAACAPPALQSQGTLHTLGVAGHTRSVLAMTDVDRVRDIAIGTDRVYAATDLGVLAYSLEGEATATRITKDEGLQSNDIRAVAVSENGLAVVATSGGLSRISEGHATAFGAEPPIGKVVDLAFRHDGSLFACGRGGVARFKDNAWVLFGEPFQCTVLENGENDSLWIGTTAGLLTLEGDDVIREHSVSRGIPEGYVQDIAPMPHGEALALLRGPSQSQLGYWDGRHWYGYTLENFHAEVVGLVPDAAGAMLLVDGHGFVISHARDRSQVRLTPVAASQEYGVRSYRARITPAASVTVPSGDGEAERAAGVLMDVPQNLPSMDAPALQIAPVAFTVPDDVYAATRAGDAIAFADHNRGLVYHSAAGDKKLRTRDLVADHLSTATDSAGHTWLATKNGDLVQLDDHNVLRRMPLPENVYALSLAMGEGGAYLLTRVGKTGAVLRVYRADSGRWTQLIEHALTLPGPLAGAPFFGVAHDGTYWVAIELKSGSGARMRGAVSIDSHGTNVVYHHRGATAAADGAGATTLVDEISGMTIANDSVWFASLNGAVRVADGQAVVYGEARGVRGEIVSDVLAASGKVWLAAAEGIGAYENGHFDFAFPRAVQDKRPIALAMDIAGHLYCAGPHGVVYQDGTAWQTMSTANGLPTDDLRDISVDTRDRVWLLTADELLLFTPVPNQAPSH